MIGLVACSFVVVILVPVTVKADEGRTESISVLRDLNSSEILGTYFGNPSPQDVEQGNVLRLPVSCPIDNQELRVRIAPVGNTELSWLAAQTLRVETGQSGKLQTVDGIEFAEYHCSQLEVLEETRQKTRVRLRDKQSRFVLVGWVPTPLPPHGTKQCGPRVVKQPAGFSGVVWHPKNGPPVDARPPDPVVPWHFLRVDPGAATFRLIGKVWQLTDGTCQEWDFRERHGEVSLERRSTSEEFGGRWEVEVRKPFQGGNPPRLRYAEYYLCRWVREPPAQRKGEPGCLGAIGAVWDFSVVRVTSERIEWIDATEVIAYHPADVSTWFRTSAACHAERQAKMIAPSP